MSVYEDLLNFVPWVKARSGVTIAEVAQHFDWTEELVVQYVLLASVTGPGTLPGELLDLHIDGERINVIDTLGLDRPFRFDQIEAACILLGLQVLEQNPQLDSGISLDDLASLKTKILDVLPHTPSVLVIQPEGDSENADLIKQAIQTGTQIQFRYWNEARESAEVRIVSPQTMRLSQHHLRLDGYCHTRMGWRTFNLTRIQDLEILNLKTEFPDEEFQDMSYEEVEISVPLDLLYQLENMRVKKRTAPKAGQVKAVVEVLEPAWLARQILSSGCQIEVLGPKKFSKKVNEFISQAQAAYK